MEKILEDCGKLEQIGKSNNSVIYKLLSKEGKPTGRALKLVMHDTPEVHPKECMHLHNEATLLGQVRHPAILRNHGDILSSVSIKNSHFCALQLELADTDLFDKIAKTYPNPIEPKFIRQAFMQVIQGLEYLHNEHQIAHNDIKLENMFLLKNKVKLADFGFAHQLGLEEVTPENQYKTWKNRCKTPLAPEVLSLISGKSKDVFDEKQSDIFALGVSLFQSLFLRAPFSEEHASDKDDMFRHFYSNEKQKFWDNEEILSTMKYLAQFEDFRQESFVDLINLMFEVNPAKRINIKQITKHPWFKQVNQEQTGNNLASCTQF